MSQMVPEGTVEDFCHALTNFLVHAGDRVETLPNLPLLLFDEELERLNTEGIDNTLQRLGRGILLALFDFADVARRESAALGELFLGQSKPLTTPPEVFAEKGS